MNAFFSKAVLLFAESIWRQGGMNGEGYSDVTADTAIRNVEKVRKSRKKEEIGDHGNSKHTKEKGRAHKKPGAAAGHNTA